MFNNNLQKVLFLLKKYLNLLVGFSRYCEVDIRISTFAQKSNFSKGNL